MVCAGLVERIGEATGLLHHKVYANDPDTPPASEDHEAHYADHTAGLSAVAVLLCHPEKGVIQSANEVAAVGHRVVHGGEHFKQTTIIDAAIKAKIKELAPLAPLHNPPNLEGITVAERVFPKAQQVAVFDTAFHSSLPEAAYRYALPEALYAKHGIRVYGFHGTSHRFVSRAARQHLGLEAGPSKIITIHLGNGCSMAAVKDGQCIDTSMGFGPLSGLVMGTRTGDIDPSVLLFLMENGYSEAEVKRILNKDSGMKGLCGDNDLRTIIDRVAAGDASAQMAVEVYCYRIKRYIGTLMAALGGLDAIVFTAGVGENAPLIREKACEGLEHFGIAIDHEQNQARGKGLREVQAGAVKVLVIPTNEEFEIARQAHQLMAGQN